MSLHTIGITAEYNPFHNGHRWQLQTLREKSGNVPVIACMSGWVVQRGEMAAADPWIRASMAVHAGVDLVILLPAWFSLRSADYFAAGAVKTLAATGIVDTLVCGAEHTGTASSSLSSTAAWSLLPETEQQIKTLLQQVILRCSLGNRSFPEPERRKLVQRSQQPAGSGLSKSAAAQPSGHRVNYTATTGQRLQRYRTQATLRLCFGHTDRLTQRCFRRRTGPFPAGYFPRFVTVPGNQLPRPLRPTGRYSVSAVV